VGKASNNGATETSSCSKRIKFPFCWRGESRCLLIMQNRKRVPLFPLGTVINRGKSFAPKYPSNSECLRVSSGLSLSSGRSSVTPTCPGCLSYIPDSLEHQTSPLFSFLWTCLSAIQSESGKPKQMGRTQSLDLKMGLKIL